MILARNEELNILEKDYLKANSSFICLFGRKNIGKTTLLNHYAKNKRNLSFSFNEITENLYFNNISKFVYNFFDDKELNKMNNFTDFLEYLSNSKQNKKIVIILEDFHNLLKINKNALDIFYKSWKKDLKNKNLQIILSSSVHNSHKDFTNIYAKASKNIILEELDFSVLAKVLENIPKKDLMYIYACFGTNIHLLKQYDVSKDFLLNVKDILLVNKKNIYNDTLHNLKSELSEVSTYTSILYAVAMGNTKIGEIAKYINVKSSFLTRYIQKLQDLMLLEKQVPINDEPNKSKFGRYDIKDNFLKFWFCYIYPYSFLLEQNNIYPISSYIRNDFSKRLVKNAYKKYVYSIILKDSNKYLEYDATEISHWWNNKSCEIDIVAYNDKHITFIDCKWKQNDSLELSYSKLKGKSALFTTPLNKKYIIFAKK